jgi:hypothetical protein
MKKDEMHPPDQQQPCTSTGPDPVLEKYPGLVDLARRGILKLGLPNDPTLYTRSSVSLPEGTAAALLDEERADRYP